MEEIAGSGFEYGDKILRFCLHRPSGYEPDGHSWLPYPAMRFSNGSSFIKVLGDRKKTQIFLNANTKISPYRELIILAAL